MRCSVHCPWCHEDEQVLIGLPDTIWIPENGFSTLPEDVLSFLLFPVTNPELFDAVVTDENGARGGDSGEAEECPLALDLGWHSDAGRVFRDLHTIWCRPERKDEYLGTLVNAWLREGGHAVGVRSGQAYVDVGTVHGYRARDPPACEWKW